MLAMSHGPNKYRAERREAARRSALTGRDGPTVVRAQRIIAVWNSAARRGRPAEFFPTFETALTAGCSRLTYCCPACRQMATVDIRRFAEAHHPRAPISMLIVKLSCERCCPNPPLAVLLELEMPSASLPIAMMNAPETEPDRTAVATEAFVAATMGDLIRNDPRWLWLHCANIECGHKRAVAIVPFVIRWGVHAPSDRLRRSMRCMKCGHRGALTYSPAWIDANVRWQPFPDDGNGC